MQIKNDVVACKTVDEAVYDYTVGGGRFWPEI